MSASQEQPAPTTPSGGGAVIFPIERKSQIAVLSVSITFIILPTLAVFLRCLARHIARRKLEANDYCIIAAVVFTNAYQSVAIVSVLQYGVGFHFEEIVAMYGPEPFVNFLKMMIPIQLLWAVSLSLCKISILLLYTRIFTMRFMRILAWSTAGLITCFALSTILSGLLICRPLALNWDTTLEGSCGNQMLSYTITGCLNLVTDVIVLLLPLPYLWKLQMQLYKKLVIGGTFSLGICTVIISAMRIDSIKEVNYADLTFNVPKALILSSLEPSLGVTLACIPLLRPLLGRSRYSKTGTARYSISGGERSRKEGIPAVRSVGVVHKDGFAVLDDDSSQHQLRPLGAKHNAVVSHADMGSRGSSHDEAGVDGGSNRGITVKQTWVVTDS